LILASTRNERKYSKEVSTTVILDLDQDGIIDTRSSKKKLNESADADDDHSTFNPLDIVVDHRQPNSSLSLTLPTFPPSQTRNLESCSSLARVAT
jgi:hypothetical protein